MYSLYLLLLFFCIVLPLINCVLLLFFILMSYFQISRPGIKKKIKSIELYGTVTSPGEGSIALQMVGVRVVSEESCARSYGNLVTPRMLCAGYRQGGRDACQVG